MNLTKIEWTRYTWNPVTGCLNGCWYCYAKKIFTRFHRSFEPTLHPDRLDQPRQLKTPSKIFVCSVADLFAPWTPKEWMWKVLSVIEHCPVLHTFQLLTKKPESIPVEYHFPDNVWVGTTVTCENNDWAKNGVAIKQVDAKVRFVSFEPLLGPPPEEFCLGGLQWVIIGSLTGPRKITPQRSWVLRILHEALAHDIPVFIKNNMNWDTQNEKQFYPKG